MRIVVAGASGFIGTALLDSFASRGYEVLRLVRPGSSRGRGAEVPWNPAFRQLDARALAGADAVVNLCGENLAGRRWTRARKRVLADSRTVPAAFLAQTMARMERPPRVFVSASAIGFYDGESAAPCDESSPAGHGFLARLTGEWEEAARAASGCGVRVVYARFGSVLGRGGGMLGKLLPAFRLGLGGRIGGGEQTLSWIALDDVLAALAFLLERAELSGPVNLVAPVAVSNAEFTRTLAAVLRRPALVPLPAPIISALFGEMGRALLLGGPRVLPRRLQEAGFVFAYPELGPALEHLLAP